MFSRIAVAFSCLAIVPLSPAQPPKPASIDFTAVLNGVDGKPLLNGDSASKPPLTLSDVACVAVNQPLQSDPQNLSAAFEDQKKRAHLVERIYKAKAAVLSPAEVSQIEERIATVWKRPDITLAAARLLSDPTADNPK